MGRLEPKYAQRPLGPSPEGGVTATAAGSGLYALEKREIGRGGDDESSHLCACQYRE